MKYFAQLYDDNTQEELPVRSPLYDTEDEAIAFADEYESNWTDQYFFTDEGRKLFSCYDVTFVIVGISEEDARLFEQLGL